MAIQQKPVFVLYNRLVGKRQVPQKFTIGCRGHLLPVDVVLSQEQINSSLEDLVVAKPNQIPDGTLIFYGILHGMAPMVRYAIRSNHPYAYIDHAYWFRGHDEGNYKVTLNGIQAGKIVNRPADRWNAIRKRGNFEIKPWKKDGNHILVCPPSNHMIHFWELGNWQANTIDQLRKVTDRPIIIRTKPKKNQMSVPLEEHLKNCHAVVTFNSNVATESLMAGVPVFCHRICAASTMSELDFNKIETPLYPDNREMFFRHLAYSQFHHTEFIDGTCWRIIQETYEKQQ